MKLLITPRFFENNVEQLISVERKYYPFFEKHGYSIHMIPIVGMNLEEYFDWMNPNGIIFGGGYRLYTDEIRKFETDVLEIALSRGLPILAICCGMWTVNYHFGGTLKFDESHQAFDGEKIIISKWIHPVIGVDLVKEKKYKVNSFHSKIIESVGEGLKSFLVTKDNVVEGVYNLDRKIIGIQFHMENKGVSDDLSRQIMDIYGNMVTAYSSGH